MEWSLCHNEFCSLSKLRTRNGRGFNGRYLRFRAVSLLRLPLSSRMRISSGVICKWRRLPSLMRTGASIYRRVGGSVLAHYAFLFTGDDTRGDATYYYTSKKAHQMALVCINPSVAKFNRRGETRNLFDPSARPLFASGCRRSRSRLR